MQKHQKSAGWIQIIIAMNHLIKTIKHLHIRQYVADMMGKYEHIRSYGQN